MKKNKVTKFMAIFALFGIIIGVVGTGILILTTNNEPETYKIKTNTGINIDEILKTSSGIIK